MPKYPEHDSSRGMYRQMKASYVVKLSGSDTSHKGHSFSSLYIYSEIVMSLLVHFAFIPE